MKTNYLVILVVSLMLIGSLGFVYSNPPVEIPTAPPPGGEEGGGSPSGNNTTVNGTILVSQSSQNLVIIRNVTNTSGNNSSVSENPNGQVIKIRQVTPSGSIPHIVEVDDGTNSYQLYAYCVEPSQKAQSGASLTAEGVEGSAVILKTIKNSNPENDESATDAQMKIWVLLSGGSTDASIGEGSSYATTMSTSQLQSELDRAKNEIMDDYNVSEDQIAGLVDYKPVDVTGSTMMSNFALSVQNTLHVNPKRIKLNISNNTTVNNTTNNVTNQTNINVDNTQNISNSTSSGNSSTDNILQLILRLFNL